MKIKKFNEQFGQDFEEDWEEIDEEKVKLIADIMNIENNDPLSDKMGDDLKKISLTVKEKLSKKLDNINIKDLKILKQLSEIEHEKRKIMAKHYDSVMVAANIIQEIVKEIEDDL